MSRRLVPNWPSAIRRQTDLFIRVRINPAFPRQGAPEREGFRLVLGFRLGLLAISYAGLRRFRIPP
jgi:hypothetical protein